MNAPEAAAPLSLLSIVIPARDEEDCIASTVEHLHIELRLRNVPHEIIVERADRRFEQPGIAQQGGNRGKVPSQFAGEIGQDVIDRFRKGP